MNAFAGRAGQVILPLRALRRSLRAAGRTPGPAGVSILRLDRWEQLDGIGMSGRL